MVHFGDFDILKRSKSDLEILKKNRKSKRLLLGESEAALDHGGDGGI